VAQVWPWDLCTTLTLDPRKAPVVAPGPQLRPGRGRLQWPIRLTEGDSPRVLKAPVKTGTLAGRIRYWLRDCQRELGRELVAMGALELHKSGEPHYHGLVGIAGGLQGTEIAALNRLWFEKWGATLIERPRQVGDVAAYAAKYLTKDIDQGGVLIYPPDGPLGGLQLALGGSGGGQ
jgi:hypothetical protein